MALSLEDYITKLKNIDAPMQKVYRGFKQEVMGLLLETFDQQENPYGEAWAERKHEYDHPILNDSGNLRSRFKITVKGNTFTITNDARTDSGYPYARPHQLGLYPQNAQRMMIPTGELPGRWVSTIQDYFYMTLQDYLEG